MAKKKVSKKKVAKKVKAVDVQAGKGGATRSAITTSKLKPKKAKTTKKPIGTCFVLMPFKEPFGTYYNVIIEPAVTKAQLHPQRGNSLFLPTPIMGDIWDMIQDASVLLAELTGKNANVFYELGLGHAIGKPIVLISEKMDDVPFDLQALRVILYNKDDPKWGDKLRNDIVIALKATLSEPIRGVPTMFRKKVKSQAPAESETSLRLSSLERRVASLQDTFGMEEVSRRSSIIRSEQEAMAFVKRYVRMGMPNGLIVRRLKERGVPSSWILAQIEQLKSQRSLFDTEE